MADKKAPKHQTVQKIRLSGFFAAYLPNRLKIASHKTVSYSIMTDFDFLKIASDDSEAAFNSAALGR